VGVTAPIAEDFQTRLGVPAELVTNGFDPELGVDKAPAPAPEDQRRLTFVHTGALSGPPGRDPRPLLQALRRLIDEAPELRGRLQLVVAGRSEDDERALVQGAGVADTVRHLGYLPRSEALALQRAAGTLLLMTSRNRGEATGKLYEYMASGRPIIALAEGNEAARIVAETNTGVLVAPDDVEAIVGALRRAMSGELERAYAPRGTERYAYPALAERMASVVELAIERRACSRMS
jgi:glycosyltransferase involved in cell wall biosynthesis